MQKGERAVPKKYWNSRGRANEKTPYIRRRPAFASVLSGAAALSLDPYRDPGGDDCVYWHSGQKRAAGGDAGIVSKEYQYPKGQVDPGLSKGF